MNPDLAISEYVIGNNMGSMIFQTCTETYAILGSDSRNINITDFICSEYVPKVIAHSYIIQMHNNSDASCVLTDPWGLGHSFVAHDLHSIRTVYVMNTVNDGSQFALSSSDLNVYLHITMNYYVIDATECPINNAHSRQCSLAVHPLASPRTVNEFKWDVYDLKLSRVHQNVSVPSGVYTGVYFEFHNKNVDASFGMQGESYSISDLHNSLSFMKVFNDVSECTVQLTGTKYPEVRCKMYTFYSTTSLNYSTFSSRYYKDHFSCVENHVHFNSNNTNNRKIIGSIYSQSNSTTPIHCECAHSVMCEHIHDADNVDLTNSYIYGYIDMKDNSVHIVNDSEMHLSATEEQDKVNICVFFNKTS